jgi:hypothetical protein
VGSKWTTLAKVFVGGYGRAVGGARHDVYVKFSSGQKRVCQSVHSRYRGYMYSRPMPRALWWSCLQPVIDSR